MERWQRVIIVGFVAMSVLFLAFVMLVGTGIDLIIDDGCEVEEVEILPDRGDLHHYNLTLLCEDGERTMEVLTKDSPPDPGNKFNPLRDSSLIPAISGIVLLLIGLFLCLLIVLELMPRCRIERRQKNSLGDQLLHETPERIEV